MFHFYNYNRQNKLLLCFTFLRQHCFLLSIFTLHMVSTWVNTVRVWPPRDHIRSLTCWGILRMRLSSRSCGKLSHSVCMANIRSCTLLGCWRRAWMALFRCSRHALCSSCLDLLPANSFFEYQLADSIDQRPLHGVHGHYHPPAEIFHKMPVGKGTQQSQEHLWCTVPPSCHSALNRN